MIERPSYLQELNDLKDTNVIKVVTGIRRCGKSTLFSLYQNTLMEQGVEQSQIISINFKDLEFEELTHYRVLYNYVEERLIPDKMNYIFLDEIQNVEQFQEAVDSLYIKKNVDLYITDSNAYLLSGKLETLLLGRYVVISMLPLSFKEYMSAMPDQSDLLRRFQDYQTDSSFPGALELKGRNKIHEYLGGIYSTIILKDVVARLNISDVYMLESVIKFMFNNVGNLCNPKKIVDIMTSTERSVSAHTIEKYLKGLVDSLILHRAGRYDIKGKQYLKTGEKYYLADVGLRYYLLGTKDVDRGHLLENIVYLELIRRGYEVCVGRLRNGMVDFIATNDEGVEYYQVSLSVRDEETLKRELAPLDAIKDHNPKYLLTMDDNVVMSYHGIRLVSVVDWLLK